MSSLSLGSINSTEQNTGLTAGAQQQWLSPGLPSSNQSQQHFLRSHDRCPFPQLPRVKKIHLGCYSIKICVLHRVRSCQRGAKRCLFASTVRAGTQSICGVPQVWREEEERKEGGTPAVGKMLPPRQLPPHPHTQPDNKWHSREQTCVLAFKHPPRQPTYP